jgi:hypothetical protein
VVDVTRVERPVEFPQPLGRDSLVHVVIVQLVPG